MTTFLLKFACLRLLAYSYVTRTGIHMIQSGMVKAGVTLIRWSSYRSLLILAGMRKPLIDHQIQKARSMEA